MDICRRVWLIIAAIRILDRNSGVHGQSGIKQTIITPVLMYLTCRERRIELQTVVQYPLFAHEAGTVFLTTGNNIQAITFLIIDRQTEIAVLI